MLLSNDISVKMHLFFFIRGNYPVCEIWKTLAQGLFWQWKRINLKTQKEENVLVQGALRPSVLGAYEYVFPEEALPELLAVMGRTHKDGDFLKDGLTRQAKNYALRRILGVRKIPKKIFQQAEKIAPSIKVEGSTRGLSTLMVPGCSIISSSVNIS